MERTDSGFSSDASETRPVSEGRLDPDRIHNKAADYARFGDYEKAYSYVVKGLESFPESVDLLADAAFYSNSAEGNKYIAELMRLGFERWNWRAFLFSVDHFLDVELVLGNDEGRRTEYLKNAMRLAEEFIRRFPSDERAYRCKAKVLQARNRDGDRDAAESIYRSLVIDGKVPGTEAKRLFPVAQCCVEYIDELLERGAYEDVITAAEVGIASTAQEQPSANMGYFFYTRALAEDSIIQQRCCESNRADAFAENRHLIEAAMLDYRVAMMTLGSGSSYKATIRCRSAMLSVLGDVEGLDESLFPADLSSIENEDLIRELMRRGILGQDETADGRF